ncbi:MAG: Tim44 domain-containing protein [Hyphomicrobiales bacterium]|nr:Tim44 domain-containing protein [Hyphomicrobiales bacterium]
MDNGFQFFDIILFAMIAAFLVLRLRSILGRRDGHEGGFPDPFKRRPGKPARPSRDDGDNVVQLPDRSEPEDEDKNEDVFAEAPESQVPPGEMTPLMQGLSAVRAADPSFTESEFVNGARIAFEMILNAYVAGDTAQLKTLLSPEVFSNFQQAIREREKAGEVLEETLVGINSAEIVEADMEGRTASVTVKFVSEQVSVTRDEAGDVIDGDPSAVTEVTDFWTFSRDTRSRNPNWALVATRSLD